MVPQALNYFGMVFGIFVGGLTLGGMGRKVGKKLNMAEAEKRERWWGYWGWGGWSSWSGAGRCRDGLWPGCG